MMTIKSTTVNSIIWKDAIEQHLLHSSPSLGQVVMGSIEEIEALRYSPALQISSDETSASYSLSPSTLETIELNPGLKFTVEERNRVNYLLELEQSNVISFNDLEYEVASKVIQEMFDKAFSNTTMDYELIFWGYTFAIKKITWFAQVLNKHLS